MTEVKWYKPLILVLITIPITLFIIPPEEQSIFKIGMISLFTYVFFYAALVNANKNKD